MFNQNVAAGLATKCPLFCCKSKAMPEPIMDIQQYKRQNFRTNTIGQMG